MFATYELTLFLLPICVGYLIDLTLGDPDNWPHPIRVFGNLISNSDRLFNRCKFRFFKGMFVTILLCTATYVSFFFLNKILENLHFAIYITVNSLLVWYGLANKSLITEGRQVFEVLKDGGIEAGRKQLSRIVGRDTSQLTPQQIRIAVLETMSENLSDGVIAPLFFYLIGGVPAMMTYKMINTLDSMIGYRNERYEQFGKFAARLDDVANFIPARITALLMVITTSSSRGFRFLLKFGNKHKSPNAGYPEAALAGILNCRFGGPNVYHGTLVDKPYIGKNDRSIEHNEIYRVISINQRVCFLMVVVIVLISTLFYQPLI